MVTRISGGGGSDYKGNLWGVGIVLHFVHVGRKLSFKVLVFSINDFEKILTVLSLNL